MSLMISNIQEASPRALAHVHLSSWKEGYRGIVDESLLSRMSLEKRTQDWEKWLGGGIQGFSYSEDDTVTGFLTYEAKKTNQWELMTLYVAPDSWGHGIARSLMDAYHAILPSSALSFLYVVRENARAITFYGKCEYAMIGEPFERVVFGATVNAQRMERLKTQ